MAKTKTINKQLSSNKNLFQNIRFKIYRKPSVKLYAALVGAILLALIAISAFILPKTAPLALDNVISKSTGWTAPKLDLVKGNYSVSGEATSTSLLVKYRDGTSKNTRDNINKQFNAKTNKRISRLDVDIVQVDSNESVGEIIKKYKSRSEVAYVEPNYLAKSFLTPNDTLFSKQWNLQKIEAPKAWDISQGGYGPIAVVDTGVDTDHPDLSGYLTAGYNFVNNTTNTNDDSGHGTHVAGIISASSNNSIGIASIGFRGSLLPVKVLDSTGAGTYGNVASGIIYAADSGAKIINLSLGGSSPSQTLRDALTYAMSKGSIIVAAAGNNGNNSAVYPAAYSGVIAVAASDQNDNLASFSSYGNDIYVSAPGVSIISTYNSGGYATMSGTSMAAPTVSGLIGLALSKGATTASTVLSNLKTTSDKIGAYTYDANGWNQYFGYGRINAARLLGALAITQPTAPNDNNNKGAGKSSHSNNRSSNSPRATSSESPNLQFDTVIEGSIDSIDLQKSNIVIKIKSSSETLHLESNSLVDLTIDSSTAIKLNNRTAPTQSLRVGDNLNVKAHWSDNKLTALEIKLQGSSASSRRN